MQHRWLRTEQPWVLLFYLAPGQYKMRVLIFILSERWPLSDWGRLLQHVGQCHAQHGEQAEQMQNAPGGCSSYLGHSPIGDQDVHTAHHSSKHMHRYRNKELPGSLVFSDVRRKKSFYDHTLQNCETLRYRSSV